MKGLAVLLVFFVIFLASSLAIPSPLFPGNVACYLLGISNVSQFSLVNAVVNGVFYGFVAWIVISLSFKWIEKSLSKNKLVEEKK